MAVSLIGKASGIGEVCYEEVVGQSSHHPYFCATLVKPAGWFPLWKMVKKMYLYFSDAFAHILALFLGASGLQSSIAINFFQEGIFSRSTSKVRILRSDMSGVLEVSVVCVKGAGTWSFEVQAFGLASAPRCFTNLLTPEEMCSRVSFCWKD